MTLVSRIKQVDGEIYVYEEGKIMNGIYSIIAHHALSLLKSKRTWVVLLTAAAKYLHGHYPAFQLSDADANAIADQVLLAIGAVSVIGTKVIDSVKTQPQAQIPQNKDTQ